VQERIAYRIKILRQFLVMFLALFSFSAFKHWPEWLATTQEITIFETTPALENLFSLETKNLTSLELGDIFDLIINLETNQEINFAQIVLEYDQNLLLPLFPSQKLHSFDHHKEAILDNNKVRISATNLSEIKAVLGQVKSFSGSTPFASLQFKILTDIETETKLKMILLPAKESGEIDWLNTSALVNLNSQDNVVNLLNEGNQLIIEPRIESQREQNTTTPSTTSAEIGDDFFTLFATLVDDSEITQATKSANASDSADIKTISSPSPSPEIVSINPQPEQPKLSFWMRIWQFLSQFIQIAN
jgi:hypothetical protein